ncbi:hypothetical protein Q3C01_32160 [Bradyrhizobium sp. UFLA05-109]
MTDNISGSIASSIGLYESARRFRWRRNSNIPSQFKAQAVEGLSNQSNMIKHRMEAMPTSRFEESLPEKAVLKRGNQYEEGIVGRTNGFVKQRYENGRDDKSEERLPRRERGDEDRRVGCWWVVHRHDFVDGTREDAKECRNGHNQGDHPRRYLRNGFCPQYNPVAKLKHNKNNKRH